MIKMKLSSVLLSSAALLVAGAAYAADLPAKKAAPAAAPTGCAAFGAGFFQIPGGETCIQFSGRVYGQMAVTGGSQAASATTMRGHFRMATQMNSNTELGTLIGYGRFTAQQSAATAATLGLDYARVLVGSFTVGLTDSTFANEIDGGFGMQGGLNDSAVLPSFQYSMPMGSSTLTVAIEDQTTRNNIGTNGGVSSIPDVVGKLKLPLNATTNGYLNVAGHNMQGATSGNQEGYAVQGEVDTTMGDTVLGASVAYANGALAYLGSGSKYGSSAGYDFSSATIGTVGTGIAGQLSAKQKFGSSYVYTNLYASSINNVASTTYKAYGSELGYYASVAKQLWVAPAVTFGYTDNGSGTTYGTVAGYLRIQRDF